MSQDFRALEPAQAAAKMAANAVNVQESTGITAAKDIAYGSVRGLVFRRVELLDSCMCTVRWNDRKGLRVPLRHD